MPKIVLISMIKNESRIISRCLENLKNLVDYYCITDTGSTDNTVQVCTDYLTALGKPFKIYNDTFKNFGHNRSASFKNALEFITDLEVVVDDTFGLLLDADMILKTEKEHFDTSIFSNYDEVHIIQKNDSTHWYNSRFLRMSLDWRCIGYTHEVWLMFNKITCRRLVCDHDIWIDDVSDGGCKSDKFERDARLLNEELLQPNMMELNKERCHFYLGQTYMSLGNFEKAIEHYSKRVELGSWEEEQWYACFSLAKCMWMLNHNIEETSAQLIKAYEMRPTRAESLAALAETYFNNMEYDLALKYVNMGIDVPYPIKDLLNVEPKVYKYFFKLMKLMIQNATSSENLAMECLDVLSLTGEVYYLIFNHAIKISDECLLFMDHTESTVSLSYAVTPNNDVILLLNNELHTENKQITIDNPVKNTKIAIYNNILCYFNDKEYGEIHTKKIGDSPSMFSMFYNYKSNSLDFIKTLYPFETCNGFSSTTFPAFLKYFVSILPGVCYKTSTFFMIMTMQENVIIHMLLEMDNDTLSYIRHSKPFYYETKGIETCISFSIDNTGIINTVYNLDSKYKLIKFSTSDKLINFKVSG